VLVSLLVLVLMLLAMHLSGDSHRTGQECDQQ
jgi:hypothetical protein